MPILRVTGIARLDGDYDADISSFTQRELHLIKKESGVRAGEIQEAFEAGDSDLVVAIALIVLQRAGKGDASQYRDAVWDSDVGSITFDLTDEERAEAEKDDALPPTSEPAATGNASDASGLSGEPSTAGSEPLANGRSRTGSPLSDRSASDPVTSAT